MKSMKNCLNCLYGRKTIVPKSIDCVIYEDLVCEGDYCDFWRNEDVDSK